MQAVVDQLIDIFTVYGLDVLGALAILIIGWTAAGWIRNIVYRGLGKVPNMDGTLQPFLANTVRWAILAFVIVAVLNQFGVETTSMIAVLGAAGLAIGLALQGTLSNVASGVMLLVLRPFHAGDFITAGSLSGTVVEIGLFTSELKTGDGIYIMLGRQRRLLGCPVGLAKGCQIRGRGGRMLDSVPAARCASVQRRRRLSRKAHLFRLNNGPAITSGRFR